MAQQTASALLVTLLLGTLVGGGVALTVVAPAPPGTATSPDGPGSVSTAPTASLGSTGAELTRFSNRSAFEAYLVAGQRRSGVFVGGTVGGDGAVVRETARADVPADAASGGAGGDDGGTAPSRIAGTNVQVAGLDEPDLVKTDGSHFYYAPANRRYVPVEPVAREPDGKGGVVPPEKYRQPETHVIDASDPDAPEAVAHINTTGKLLQTGDRLVVFERDRIAGYDVSDPQHPTEVWSHPLDSRLVTARERDGTVYVVTETYVGVGTPCPVEPLGADHAIACSDIYRPRAQIPADATYTAFSLDAVGGQVRDSVSFVGTSANSVVYMSPDALYVTYTQSTDRATLLGDFLLTEFEETPDRVRDRIAEIRSYDISATSESREISRAVQQWLTSVPDQERRRLSTELGEGLSAYVADRQRTLTETGIVRVDVSDDALTVGSTGVVPGRPLNQFSLDQYEGTLRIATTIPAAGSAHSVNDLYTLDAGTLDRKGSVTGMGDDERVYSVRYVEDTAYVVTFRRVDPFHVVDLSDPADPAEVGQLKLPGFSSYLHPVDGNHVLGIGEEEGRVKTVLFDVSDPSNPTVADSEVLDQRYSAVAGTHHAFLMDRKHGVFFLPAGRESVVMNYTGGDLTVETTVETGVPATRARYVEDSLYVFAGQRVTVLDELTWERTTTLDLSD